MKFKKGDLVIRIRGYVDNMLPGDMDVVSTNQKYPGILKLARFPGDHDPNNFILIPEKSKKYQEAFAQGVLNTLHKVHN